MEPLGILQVSFDESCITPELEFALGESLCGEDFSQEGHSAGLILANGLDAKEHDTGLFGKLFRKLPLKRNRIIYHRSFCMVT